uniref:Uncharacterized protein n=2 Tax=Mustelidae TaxID=9655 RepID=M3YB06_MUSPF
MSTDLTRWRPALPCFLHPRALLQLIILPVRLSYVNYAEDLASKLLQCSPKNRLSAQAALSHEYFSDLPPRLWELTDMSSIFTVPNVRLQPEAGESMRAFGKNNSYGKSLSNSKH